MFEYNFVGDIQVSYSKNEIQHHDVLTSFRPRFLMYLFGGGGPLCREWITYKLISREGVV